MALCGALLSEGWDLPRVERFVFALATAGADEEAADRVDNARSQWDALQRGAPMTGWPSLAGYAGSDSVDLVKRYLGIRSRVGRLGSGDEQPSATGQVGRPGSSPHNPHRRPTWRLRPRSRAR